MSNPSSKTKPTVTRTIEVISAVASIVATLAAILALLPGTQGLFGLPSSSGTAGELATKAQIESINSEIAGIKQEQMKLNDQINALSQSAPPNVLASDVAGLKTSVDNVDKRLTTIEKLIVRDAPSALEIPLIRKDLENISTTTELQISAIRQDVERSYNLILVTIVALAIAVLAPALGNIFRRDKEGKEKD